MKISLAESYTDALGRLPKEIKGKASDTTSKFGADRTQRGLNYEKIKAADDNIYSLRVNDDYRIICKCPNGDDTIFLFVGKHDEAYEWAQRHVCSADVNGVVSVHGAVEPARKIVDGRPISRLSVLTDNDFIALDVPREFIDALRKVYTSNQLNGFKDSLSEETYMVLDCIVRGEDKESALEFYNDYIKTEIIVPAIEKTPLFNLLASELAHIGVPTELIDLVKGCKSEEEFRRIEGKLPENAVQNLYAWLDGEAIESIMRRSKSGNKSDDICDYSVMLSNPGTKQNIVTVENQFELNGILEMPMEKWRVFLHPDQRHIVEATYNGPARVLGGAGTGKTVIVVHRARELARKCTGNEVVLVTTFSNTLADDISNRLALICTEKELRRIVVSTLDRLVARFSKEHIKYDKKERKFPKSPLEYAWNKAIDRANYDKFDAKFYMAEWGEVIQNQGITTREQYINALRIGRGDNRVDRKARNEIYTVMEHYKGIMEEMHWIDIDWAENKYADILRRNQDSPRFKHILVDECQDFKGPALRFIRALAGEEHQNDLFLSGDTRQRIYSGRVSLSSFGINVKNRSTQLKVNYRTTREIYNLSFRLQKGFTYDDLDNNPTSKDESVSTRHGEGPSINGYSSTQDEMKAVLEDVKKRIKEGILPSEICIAAKTNMIASKYCEMLENNGVESIQLKPEQPDDKSIPGVRTSTMHRIKGMEFDCMYVVSVNDGLLPYRPGENEAELDKIALLELLKKEANLLSVAITRARKTAWISYYGKPSVLLDKVL